MGLIYVRFLAQECYITVSFCYFSDPETKNSNLPTAYFSLLGAVHGAEGLGWTLAQESGFIFFEKGDQIHKLSLCVKDCAKYIAYIISPFLTNWKINITIFIVYIRKMLLAELELNFKPKFCRFPCSFCDTVLSPAMSCCFLCPHTTSYFLIPDISHLFLSLDLSDPINNQSRPAQIITVCLLFDAPIALGHIIGVSHCVLVGFMWISLSS